MSRWSTRKRCFSRGLPELLSCFICHFVSFQNLIGEVTGQPVAVYQRIDQAGQRLPIDDRILADTDTLMVFGLDHIVTGAGGSSSGEIEALQNFLRREGTCLILGPHHDVGVSDNLTERQMEYSHHGDPLVPRQQRFGKYTRSVMKGLGVPVENRYGLRPATIEGTKRTVPLSVTRPGHQGMDDRRGDVRLSYAPATLCRDHG